MDKLASAVTDPPLMDASPADSLPQQISLTEADIGRHGQYVDENWRRSACVMVGLSPEGLALLRILYAEDDGYLGPKPFSRDFRPGHWTLLMP